MSISEARSTSYRYLQPICESYSEGSPILSVIIDCYYRLDLVRQSIQSVLNQDYPNVELILVDNGAQPDIRQHLARVHANSKNTVLIKFEENQFSWDDVEKPVAICWNAALIHAKGDFVCHLSYDDLLSNCYASRMVKLFVDNPACVTAAPLQYSINDEGHVNTDSSMRDRNRRDRYIDGLDLAIDLIKGHPKKLMGQSGEILVIRRKLLLQHGGFDRLIDLSQILKYAILGVSGFDKNAALYWRHHEWQLNRQAKRRGTIWYSSLEKAWSTSGIVEMWRQRFDEEKVNALLEFKKRTLDAAPLTVISENTRKKNLRGVIVALINMARECPSLLPRGLYSVFRELVSMTFGKIYHRLRSRN